MKKYYLFILTLFMIPSVFPVTTLPEPEIINTSAGKIKLYFLGHASLLLEFNQHNIYIDPWEKQADYSNFSKADLILITHEHQDHLDQQAITRLSTPNTEIWCNPAVRNLLNTGVALKNGDKKSWKGVVIEAVPAYNTTAGRDKFHPKGRDNGYVLTFGDTRTYVAGDTEDIPEMKSLGKIYAAILPMNQPYTMTPEQVVNAVSFIKPSVIYPYHTTEKDVSSLEKLLSGNKSVELRVRISN